MNGENNNPFAVEKLDDTDTPIVQSVLGMLAVKRIDESIPDDANERVEQAKTLVTEIRQLCEAELTFNGLIIKGLSNRDDDNEPDIKLVWGGKPFPLYEHKRIASYVDAQGKLQRVIITIEVMGSYALRADELPRTNGDPNKEQVKLNKFKKNLQKKQLWGMNITIAAIKDELAAEDDKEGNTAEGSVKYIVDITSQYLYTLSFRNSDNQSIFRSIDPEDLAQLQLITDLVKSSSHI